jgi:Family of unknown function (DUF6529)
VTERAPGMTDPSVTLSEPGPAAVPQPDPALRRLLIIGLVGAAIALTLGIYANAHTPSSDLVITLGFSNTITMKVWLTTIALLFALVQLVSALWMYGRLPLGTAPAWLGDVHRISGRLAFLISLPVAYHCLYQLGFQHSSFRVLLHSVLGCLFYGAFAAKVLIVRSRGLPGSALPIAGGLVFVLLVYVWLLSGLWYIDHFGFPSP